METEVLDTIEIVRTPNVLFGKPRIKGHRISVQLIAELYVHAGRSIDEILEEMPTLNHAKIYAALSYYYDHREEIEANIQREEESVANNPNVIHATFEEVMSPDFMPTLTPQEIAEKFGITVDAVYQAVRRGTIPHRRSGSTILISRLDAEKRWRTPSKRGRPRKK